MITSHLIVKGKVQGVFFRASAKEMAGKLKLTGWVSNRKNGDVEIMVSGEEAGMGIFIKWCHQGPPRAIVDEVIAKTMPPESFNDFRILR